VPAEERPIGIIESKERQEAVKFHISRFIENKIREAIEMKKKSPEKHVLDCVRDVWQENTGEPWHRKPQYIISGLNQSGTSVKVNFDLSSRYDSTNNLLTLNSSALREAETEEELEMAYLITGEDIYHEVEHLYTPGAEAEFFEGQDPEEKIKATVEYLLNDGEIAAHARQFAFRYTLAHPNEAFDLEKMKQLAGKIATERKPSSINKHSNNNALNYFVSFSDPEKQEKYKKYGDIKVAHEKVVAKTSEFIALFHKLAA
jgi:hypothetical protein